MRIIFNHSRSVPHLERNSDKVFSPYEKIEGSIGTRAGTTISCGGPPDPKWVIKRHLMKRRIATKSPYINADASNIDNAIRQKISIRVIK